MDIRRVIGFGKGSYVISMPKNWIDKNNLKKGDLISVTDEGMELTLRVNQQEKKVDIKEIDINAKGKSLDLLKVEIVSSYLNNYNTINILLDDKDKEAPKIKEIIRNLSGLEIMEQTSRRIIAKNLINVNEISIKNIVRRMDIITRAMLEDTILCYSGQCTFDNLFNRDLDINRLYFLGCRFIKHTIKNPSIAKSLGTDSWKLHSDDLILLRIEKIADQQKRIARFLCANILDKGILTDLEKVHIDMSTAYSNVMKSYYNQDLSLACNIEVTNKERIISCNKILEKYAKYTTKITVAQIIENLKSTAASIKNIARTVLCYE